MFLRSSFKCGKLNKNEVCPTTQKHKENNMIFSDKYLPIVLMIAGVGAIIRSIDLYRSEDDKNRDTNFKHFKLFLTAGILVLLGGAVLLFI